MGKKSSSVSFWSWESFMFSGMRKATSFRTENFLMSKPFGLIRINDETIKNEC